MSRLRKNIEVLDLVTGCFRVFLKVVLRVTGYRRNFDAPAPRYSTSIFSGTSFMDGPIKLFSLHNFSPKLDQSPLECRNRITTTKRKEKQVSIDTKIASLKVC